MTNNKIGDFAKQVNKGCGLKWYISINPNNGMLYPECSFSIGQNYPLLFQLFDSEEEVLAVISDVYKWVGQCALHFGGVRK